MLGIDVSKDTLACTLFDPQTQKPLWNRFGTGLFPTPLQEFSACCDRHPVNHPVNHPVHSNRQAATVCWQRPKPITLAAVSYWLSPRKHATLYAAFKLVPRPTHSTATASACLPCAALCRPVPPFTRLSAKIDSRGTARSASKRAQKPECFALVTALASFGLQARELPHPENCRMAPVLWSR